MKLPIDWWLWTFCLAEALEFRQMLDAHNAQARQGWQDGLRRYWRAVRR